MPPTNSCITIWIAVFLKEVSHISSSNLNLKFTPLSPPPCRTIKVITTCKILTQMPPSVRRFTKSPKPECTPPSLHHYIFNCVTAPIRALVPLVASVPCSYRGKRLGVNYRRRNCGLPLPRTSFHGTSEVYSDSSMAVFSPFDAGSQDTALFSLL